MSLARSIATCSCAVFHRSAPEYTKELHEAMSSGQSGAGDSDEDGLGSTVFNMFHLPTFSDFVSMWAELATEIGGQRCSSICGCVSQATVTWQTALVHLCEVRQVLSFKVAPFRVPEQF